MGRTWVIVPPPYEQANVYYSKNPPLGTYKFATGKGSAYRTVQVLGLPEGQRYLSEPVDVDIGWAQIFVPAGKEPTIKFTGGKQAAEDRWASEQTLEGTREYGTGDIILPEERLIQPEERLIPIKPSEEAEVEPIEELELQPVANGLGDIEPVPEDKEPTLAEKKATEAEAIKVDKRMIAGGQTLIQQSEKLLPGAGDSLISKGIASAGPMISESQQPVAEGEKKTEQEAEVGSVASFLSEPKKATQAIETPPTTPDNSLATLVSGEDAKIFTDMSAADVAVESGSTEPELRPVRRSYQGAYREGVKLLGEKTHTALSLDDKKLADAFRVMDSDTRQTYKQTLASRLQDIGEASFEQGGELEGLEDAMKGEKARKLVSLIKKSGRDKGQISTITVKQYLDLTGRVMLPTLSMLTPDGKHIRWELALDKIATDRGFSSGEELKDRIEQVKEQMDTIDDLKHLQRIAKADEKNIKRQQVIIEAVEDTAGGESIYEKFEPRPEKATTTPAPEGERSPPHDPGREEIRGDLPRKVRGTGEPVERTGRVEGEVPEHAPRATIALPPPAPAGLLEAPKSKIEGITEAGKGKEPEGKSEWEEFGAGAVITEAPKKADEATKPLPKVEYVGAPEGIGLSAAEIRKMLDENPQLTQTNPELVEALKVEEKKEKAKPAEKAKAKQTKEARARATAKRVKKATVAVKRAEKEAASLFKANQPYIMGFRRTPRVKTNKQTAEDIYKKALESDQSVDEIIAEATSGGPRSSRPAFTGAVALDSPKIRKLKETNGLVVYAVDGEKVRKELDLDFNSGGHSQVYNYIPEGEIWVDSALSPEEAEKVSRHEIAEYSFMRQGMPYEKAHEKALAAETKPEPDVISAEISRQVDDKMREALREKPPVDERLEADLDEEVILPKRGFAPLSSARGETLEDIVEERRKKHKPKRKPRRYEPDLPTRTYLGRKLPPGELGVHL